MINKIINEDLEFISKQNVPWEKLDNSTFFVSGANSYLATYIIETLLYLNDNHHKNINIIGLTRNKEKALKKYEHHKNRNDLKFIFQDVCEPILIKDNIKINYIIHAASPASPKYYNKDPVGTLSANTIGTINLLKLASPKDFKGFLYLSTGGVYGQIRNDQIPIKEDQYGYLDSVDVKSCYSESKRMGENICACWFHQYKIPTKIARISYVYGPGMDLDDERVFSAFISNIINKNNIVMTGDGSPTRSFCYIADATVAFFTILLKGRNGEAYNVGVEKETRIDELANILIDSFPERGIKLIKKQIARPLDNAQNFVQRSCLDISKIKTLGWEPSYDLNEGAERTILSYLEKI